MTRAVAVCLLATLAGCHPASEIRGGYLLIIEPVTHEVLGEIVYRNGGAIFVDCYGKEYPIRPEVHEMRTTQDTCQ